MGAENPTEDFMLEWQIFAAWAFSPASIYNYNLGTTLSELVVISVYFINIYLIVSPLYIIVDTVTSYTP